MAMAGLSNKIEKLVKDELAMAEILGAIENWDLWYFDELDPRQEWIPTKVEDEYWDEVLDVVKRNIKESEEDGDALVGVDQESVSKDLTAMVLAWEKWYPDYKTSLDQRAWLDASGENDEIYYYDDYGTEESNGVSNVFADGFNPEENSDVDLGLLA